MVPGKILQIIEAYRHLFNEKGIGKIDYPHNELLEDLRLGLEHCHGMLDKMVEFIHEGRIEKAFRWLGFIQGILWSNKIYTLEDLKNHNCPSEGKK